MVAASIGGIRSTEHVDAGYLGVTLYLVVGTVGAGISWCVYSRVLKCLNADSFLLVEAFRVSMARSALSATRWYRELFVLLTLTAVATLPAALRFTWTPTLYLTITVPIVVAYARAFAQGTPKGRLTDGGLRNRNANSGS